MFELIPKLNWPLCIIKFIIYERFCSVYRIVFIANLAQYIQIFWQINKIIHCVCTEDDDDDLLMVDDEVAALETSAVSRKRKAVEAVDDDDVLVSSDLTAHKRPCVAGDS
jgi:hypothetical protein